MSIDDIVLWIEVVFVVCIFVLMILSLTISIVKKCGDRLGLAFILFLVFLVGLFVLYLSGQGKSLYW